MERIIGTKYLSNWKMNLKVSKFEIKPKEFLFCCFLLFIFFYFRIIEINRPFWADELITLKTLETNPFYNPLYNGVSTNLPLFYYLVKIFQVITSNSINIRFLNILISFVTLVFVYIKYSNKYQILRYTLITFLTLSPIQIYYSIELRTYALAQLLIILNYYFYKEKKYTLIFWISSFLMLLTHYSCYIYLAVIFILSSKDKLDIKIIRNYLILGLSGLAIIFLISKNTGFGNSTTNSVLNGDFSRFQFDYIYENILKLREVLSIYYNFGLHYYRVENSYLSLFKKIIQIFIAISIVIGIIKRKSWGKEIYQLCILMGLLMFFSIIFDLSGIMPFGGRHIFPFQFFYILLISKIIEQLSQKNIYLASIFIIFFSLSYFSYDFCLSQTLDIFTGNADPQGVIFKECVQKISN